MNWTGNWSGVWWTGMFPGLLAGVAGGLVLAVTMAGLGMLPTMSQLVRVDTALVGFLLLLGVAALLGAGFGALIWYQRPGAGETLVWGLVYGAFWWYLGPLTLLPLLRGQGSDLGRKLGAGGVSGLVRTGTVWRHYRVGPGTSPVETALPGDN